MKWLIMCLFSISCTIQPEQDYIEIDSSFSEREREEIFLAIEQWEEACSIEIGADIVDMGESVLIFENFGTNFIKRKEGISSGKYGTHKKGTGSIYIWPDMIEADELEFQDIVAHELGHWIKGDGGHLANGPNLMSVYSFQDGDGKPPVITDADIDFVCGD